MRRAMLVARAALPALLAFLPFLAACGGAPASATVSLRMRGTPADASVVIDDHPVGTLGLVSAHGVALPPGTHRISVSAPGFFPWDRVVQAPEGGPPLALDVALVPVPD